MGKITIDSKDFLLVAEAAERIGKPKMTLYRWIKAGKVVTIKFGTTLFVPASEVERLRKVN